VRVSVNGSIFFALETSAHLDAVAIGYERAIIRLLRSAGRQSLHFGLRNQTMAWVGGA
jgi:hypothetical protein